MINMWNLLLLFTLSFQINTVHTQSACGTAVYPLVFGGSGGHTFLKTFDVWYSANQYKFAAGGHSTDSTIGATSNTSLYPIIIMYQGDTTTQIDPIWGKVINAAYYEVTGIKMDSNGEYVVAHADSQYNKESFIILIRANLLNNQYKVIKYTDSMQGYSYKRRNLIVAARGKYQTDFFRIFVSSYRNPSGTQEGFFLQAFNFYDDMVSSPVNYNFNKQFQLVSAHQGSSNITLGLLLGEDGTHLYIMHYQKDAVLFSKINSTTGAVHWTYKYNYGTMPTESSFSRKMLSTNEDMIVGVFGRTTQGYRVRVIRLIIDNTTTAEPKNSGGNVYYDTSGMTDTWELLGSQIYELGSIRVFYYDGNTTHQGCPCMYVGSLSLSGASDSRLNVRRRMSQFPMPKTSYQNIPAFFSNDGRLFLGANGKDFYSKDALKFQYGYNQGFIMGSVDSENCYQSYQDLAVYLNLTLVTLNVTKLTSYVPFQNVSVSFYQSATTTSNLVMTKLSDKSSWCTQNPFKFESTTQPAQPEIFISGVATQLPPIVPYKVTINCLSAYSANPSYQLMTIYSTTLQPYITFSQSRLGVDIDSTAPVLYYNYLVNATFPNGQWYEINKLIKGIIADAPYVNDTYLTSGYLEPIDVHLSDAVVNVDYPPIIVVGGFIPYITINQLQGSSPPAPIFLQATTTQFQIATGLLNFTLLGSYDFEISVCINQTNGVKSSTNYNIIVNVLNDQPVFNSPDLQGYLPASDQLSIPLNYTAVYNLKDFNDTEGHTNVVCEIASVQTFSVFISNWKVSIFSSAYSDLHQIHTLTIRLKDDEPGTLGSMYTITLQFTNSPPIFTTSIQMKHSVKLNSYYNYTLPEYHDPENATPLVSIKAPLHPFAKIFDQKYLIIEPVTYSLVSKEAWSYQVVLSDQEPLYSVYEINVTYTNTPPRFMSEKPKDQKVNLNRELSYTLPQYFDEEEHEVFTVYQGSLQFVTLTGKTFTFKPTQTLEVGSYTIHGFITDGVTPDSKLDFSFKIDVINEAPFFEQALVNQKITVNESSIYQLPQISDKEDLPVTLQITFQGQRQLPRFIKQMKDQILIAPTINNDAGVYPFMISLSDTVKSTPPRFYMWKVTVLQAPKFKNVSVNAKIVSITFKISQITNYGEVLLKFNANSREFLDQLGNSTFTIKANTNQELKYNVISTDHKIAEARL